MRLVRPLSILLTSLAFTFGLSGCQSTSQPTPAGSAENKLVVATPLQASAEQQTTIRRLSDILAKVDITQDQKAELLYQRAIRYDEIGLRWLALIDLNQVIQLKPDHADAYNFLGIYFTQQQEYVRAYDSFDSVREIQPEHEYALLNRGIALYYGERNKLAVQDLEAFLALSPADPYRVVWLYLAERELDPVDAGIRLAVHRNQVKQNDWAIQIIDLFLERIAPGEFLQRIALGVKDEAELTKKACESYFYLAKYYQFKQQPNIARSYFKLALTTNVYEFVEHRFAELELVLQREQAERT